ncbi:MlaD family protein [Nocardioides sp.]|uniref:MlaD family protein n=1 Tax=Nocardioides sp. TaxID=35761 RepID=UPI00321908CC
MSEQLPGTKRTPRERLGRLRTAALAGLGLLLVGVVGVQLMGGEDDEAMTLVASFDDASPLLEGNDVRIKGVKVGTIDSIELTDDGADVVLELDRTAMPVHSDAVVTIRPVSLLGERYVELDQGTAAMPTLADGAVIGAESTGSSTDLDQVLNALDDPTSEALALLVAGLGEGMDGNGKNVADAIRALTPAFEDTSALSKVLSEQNGTLGSLVESMEQVSAGLATDRGVALDQLVTEAERLLGTTAANEAAFRSLLQQLPSTLRTARSTLAQLETTADQATPTLQALRPTTRDLEDISGELDRFAGAADPALEALNPVLARADELLEQAKPVAELLRQQGSAMGPDAKALDALTRELAPDFTTVMEFFKGWALATNSTDGLAHYFRAGVVATQYSATGLLPGPAEPSAPAQAPKAPKGPKGPRLPDLPVVPEVPLVEDLLDSVGGLTGGLLSNRTSKDGGVTGLTADQETNALNFLLGGN